jgi:hypothetical protein
LFGSGTAAWLLLQKEWSNVNMGAIQGLAGDSWKLEDHALLHELGIVDGYPLPPMAIICSNS